MGDLGDIVVSIFDSDKDDERWKKRVQMIYNMANENERILKALLDHLDLEWTKDWKGKKILKNK